MITYFHSKCTLFDLMGKIQAVAKQETHRASMKEMDWESQSSIAQDSKYIQLQHSFYQVLSSMYAPKYLQG